MPLTNPWLAGPAPEQELPRDQLEERILNLLSTQNMAVIATTNSNGSPSATPVRYYSLGLEIFYTSWNASVKSRNLRRDPRVSVGIFAPLVGQASSRGAQLFGTARTIERTDPEAAAYWEAFRWQSDHVERGRSLDDPPQDPLTVITPTRILYTEHWLRRSGFAPRQTWRATGSRSSERAAKVITLCGSAKFEAEFAEVSQRLTLDGCVVISLGMFSLPDLPEDSTADLSDVRERLAAIHLQKIRMADEVYIVDPGGYVGESARQEIAYAESLGKPVRYLSREPLA